MPTTSSVSAAASGSASSIVVSTVSGHHTLKIVGYSSAKELSTGQWIESCPFQVGGRTWHVRCCPNGASSEYVDYVSFYLNLDDTLAEAETVKAKLHFNLLDQHGKPASSNALPYSTDFFVGDSCWGFDDFIKRFELEKSELLKDDSFTVKVDVTIMSEFRVQETPPPTPVPPSDMHQHFGDLLSSKAGVDVEFRVSGEIFSAHRSVLSARSPVFRARFFGLMKEGTTTEAIDIDDMEPHVFSALLTFMYTDVLPDADQQEEYAMAQHLLVAVDMYGLDRPKLICQDKLTSSIDISSAATILALADQYNCRELKEACLVFLSDPTNLNEVIDSQGFEPLTKSCPGVIMEFLRCQIIPHLGGRWKTRA